MKTALAIGLAALGLAFAMVQPAGADAFAFLCAAPTCGAGGPKITFSLNDFDGGFDVNGSQVQLGLNSPASTSVSIIGSFVDGAAKNTFSGIYIADGPLRSPASETFFFTNVFDEITDVLSYSYTQEGTATTLSGFVIGGLLSAGDLAALGIVPTGVIPGGPVFGFGNNSANTFIQTSTGVPEPSTWAMMLAGFAAVGVIGWHRSRRTAAHVA